MLARGVAVYDVFGCAGGLFSGLGVRSASAPCLVVIGNNLARVRSLVVGHLLLGQKQFSLWVPAFVRILLCRALGRVLSPHAV